MTRSRRKQQNADRSNRNNGTSSSQPMYLPPALRRNRSPQQHFQHNHDDENQQINEEILQLLALAFAFEMEMSVEEIVNENDDVTRLMNALNVSSNIDQDSEEANTDMDREHAQSSKETPENMTFKFQIPSSLDPKDIQLELQTQASLIISAVPRSEHQNVYRIRREFFLPYDVDFDNIKATSEDNSLTVTLQKDDNIKHLRRIPIE
ncbi:hypothetical protein DFQ28_005059 [Apophysomyces sp. BC1034]|nr:hypothetical protein DFQ30_002762 [Apophysomyces sp. BC1015]KAG0194846.1 hypothetical protein DFQ28_005059 [Apophysomyces sp. BC1034]